MKRTGINWRKPNHIFLFGAQGMGHIVQFLAVVRNSLAFIRGKVAGLHRQTDQPFTHFHEVSHFASHVAYCIRPGFLIATSNNPSF